MSFHVEAAEVFVTFKANQKLSPDDIGRALDRQFEMDWGDVSEERLKANDKALIYGGKVISAYLGETGVRFLVVTEGDLSSSTIMLPEEF